MIVKEFGIMTYLYDGNDNLLYRIVDGKCTILDERKIVVFSGEVYVYNGAYCTVRGSAKAYIYDESSAEFWDESTGTVSSGGNILVRDNADITVHRCDYLCVTDNAKAHVYYVGKLIIKTRDNATVFVYMGNAEIDAWETSTVYAYASNIVEAYDKSKVYTFNRATVYAHHASTVYASGFGIVYNKGAATKIKKCNFFGQVIKQVFTVKQDMLVYKKLQDNLIATLKIVKGQKFITDKY